LTLKFTNFNFILANQLPAFGTAKEFSLWCCGSFRSKFISHTSNI